MYHIFFIYSSINGHLSCLYIYDFIFKTKSYYYAKSANLRI